MAEEKHISAIILDKQPRAESSLFITAFSQEEGLVFVYKKMSSKKTSFAPDLFDEISCQVQMPNSETAVRFLKDFDVKKHRQGLSASYEKLCAASEISEIVKLNGAHIDETQTLAELLSITFDSIETAQNLDAVKIKFLYLLAKNQGYPVKEDFFASLPASEKSDFAEILKTPILQLSDKIQQAQRLYKILKYWVQENTDLSL